MSKSFSSAAQGVPQSSSSASALPATCTQQPAAADACLGPCIQIWPNEFIRYTGTRAQLEAEGLIPDGIEWPRGAAEIRWEAEGSEYGLRRTCRRGLGCGWRQGDWWRLELRPAGLRRSSFFEVQLKSKLAELEAIRYRFSARGSAEVERYWDSREDEKFQAFKALIPGLVRPRRGGTRKAKGGKNG